MTPLVEVDGLRVALQSAGRTLFPVDGVSLRVGRGEALGLVGESGCGKSVLAMSLTRLFETPPFSIASGRVRLDGEDLVTASADRLRAIRGSRVGYVFQDPSTALNPVMRVGAQIAETIREHGGTQSVEALLEAVGLAPGAIRARQYPHELSGGMRQRVLIAMAVACGPQLLVADEPTTALDVTVQAQILDLLDALRRDRGMALLLITHDLGVAAERCERIAVMYCGRIVEEGPAKEVLERPAHPYTAGLVNSLPVVGRAMLEPIPGQVPPLGEAPGGCRFRDRCGRATEACGTTDPQLVEIGPGRSVACLHPMTGAA